MDELKKDTEYNLFGEDGSVFDHEGRIIQEWWNAEYKYTYLSGSLKDKYIFMLRRNYLDNNEKSIKIKVKTYLIAAVENSDIIIKTH